MLNRDFKKEALIARRIKIARRERGLSQEQLAKSLGFANAQTLQSMEKCRQIVPDRVLGRISRILGKRVSFFTNPAIGVP